MTALKIGAKGRQRKDERRGVGGHSQTLRGRRRGSVNRLDDVSERRKEEIL